MSDLALCEQLLQTGDVGVRETLLADAGATLACVEHLLTTARQKLQTDPADAIQRAGLAGALAEQRADLESSAHAWRVQAQARRMQGDHDQACAAFDSAAERAVQAGNTLLAAQVQIGKIDSLGWLGRSSEARKLARHLETTLHALGALEDAAKAIVNLGGLHLRSDQYTPALECFERAHGLLANSEDAIARARVQFNQASALMELNRMDEALELFETCRSVFAARDMDMDVALIDANIGFLRHISGRPSEAIAALARARDTFAGWEQTLETATCDADMGEAYRELNLHPEALECYERAIAEYQSASIVYERGRAETGRAAVLMASGRHEDALAGLGRADALFGAHRNHARRAHVRFLRAHVLRQQGQTEQAQTEARRAAQTLARKGLRGWAAEARFLHLEIELEAVGNDAQTNDPQTLRRLRRALHAVRRDAQAWARGWLESRAHQALGRCSARLGDARSALQHFRDGVAVLEQTRTLIAPEEMHVAFLRNKLSVYEDVVAMLLERGRPGDSSLALEYVERAKSRLLLERVQQTVENRLQGLQRATDENGENGGSDSRRQRENGGTPRLSPEVQARLEKLRGELSRAYHRLHALDENEARRVGSGEQDPLADLNALEQAYRNALRAAELPFEKTGQTFPTFAPISTTQELQQSLGARERLVEFYVAQGQVCAFVVTRHAVHSCCNFASLADVLHAARRLRFQLSRVGWASQTRQRHAHRFHAAIQDVLAELYNLLWRPLESLLTTRNSQSVRAEKDAAEPDAAPTMQAGDGTADNTDTDETEAEPIVLVPHGELHGLPFHAFFDGAQYALDRWEFVYAPSAAVWKAGAGHNSGEEYFVKPGIMNCFDTPALLIGVPEPGIERVGAEVEAIAELFPRARLLSRERATVAAVHANLPDCGILHIATHALYRADNPLFSGLKLADGWLLSRDLYPMRLNCTLATLSACQTGVSFVEAGDELFGLIRGFLAAGARSVAASLWPADDAATAALMEPFYRGLQQGLSKAAALRAAQQQLRSDFPHPYHWAAFVLIGERGVSTA